jgi:5-methylcytosine-specific restriction endonuclease McrA
MATTDSTCVDCGAPVVRIRPGVAAPRRCDGCRREHRKGEARRWDCRQGTPCTWCGKPRGKSRRPVCASCLKPRTLADCRRCGQPFWPWANGASHARKFCCRPKRQPKAPTIRQPAACIWCVAPFVPLNTRQVACSTTCRQRYESKRRKLRLRGLTTQVVSAKQLYKRGDGLCKLCGLQVDPSLAYPHPMAMTVDHIVPISKGGTQDDANLQLAHSRCNTSKGNRPTPPGAIVSPDAIPMRASGAQISASSRPETQSATS